MGQELERICNIAGYPIYDWAVDQLYVRSNSGSLETRDDANLLYLANKGAWVRVISSVNINAISGAHILPGYGVGLKSLSGLELEYTKLFKYYQTIAPGLLNKDQDLAKNFILFGGTSTYNGKSTQLRSGIDAGGAYNVTGNTQEITNFGYRPMPGITSVTIEATGKLGSLRQATIQFKVWDKLQLDIIDAIYFRPGFTVLLEYGHAKYYDNQGNLQSSEQYMLDNPFESLTKEAINVRIASNVRKSYGNYGGMLGIVTHFDFALNQDGGFDCTVKALSMGSVMGNFPVNHIDVFSKAYQTQLKDYLDTEKDKQERIIKEEVDNRNKTISSQLDKILNESDDLWAKLKINDPFKTLLFNTGNLPIFNEYKHTSQQINSSQIPISTGTNPEQVIQTVTTQTVNIPAPARNLGTEIITYDFSKLDVTNINVPYYTQKVDEGFNSFKLTEDISLYSTDNFNTKAYYVNPGIIYFSQLKNISDKYIATISITDRYAEKYNTTPTFIKLDVNRINSIITNKTTSILKIQDGINNQNNWKKSYDNYFDVLTNENITPNSNYIQYTYFGALNPDKTVFEILLGFPDGKKSEAREYFTSLNTQYKIKEISSKIPNGKITRIILEVVDGDINNSSGYTITLGGNSTNKNGDSLICDLSFINSIEGDSNYQNLAIDKFLQESQANAEKARKDAQIQADTKTAEIKNAYNAEQVKLTTESSSTLELMLRSILIAQLNESYNSKNIDWSKFVSDLFSEGCYAPFFSTGKLEKTTTIGGKNLQTVLESYVNGNLNSKDMLELTLRYGNNHCLMSGENLYDANGILKKDILISPDGIPQVDFTQLFKILPTNFGESANLGINSIVEEKNKISVYIPLGLFFLFLNHTAMLYNKENNSKLSDKSGVITPMTYLDFNPNTNFFLSNSSQISIDPFKFLIPFMGQNSDYDALFKGADANRVLNIKVEGQDIAPEQLFDFSQDKLSQYMNGDFKNPLNDSVPNGYVGRLMYVMTDINYLLKTIKELKSGNDFSQVYFQAIIERILADLNRALGGYNAFRLSYNDNANCYVIVDDQLQGAVDKRATSRQQDGIDKTGKEAFEIPVYGKKSVARSFELRSDMSGRIASLLAISANPVARDQVATARNTSDFGIYNAGTYDRFINGVTDSPTNATGSSDNFAEFEAQANFNRVVKTIYTLEQPIQHTDTKVPYMDQGSVDRALSYYTNALAKKKNLDSGSATAMIIPMKSSMTMDGFSGLYPFQLYSVSDNVMPYRYTKSNLGDKKVAFSIARMTHIFANNEWTTSLEGFMTLLKPSNYYDKILTSKPVTEGKPSITEAEVGAIKEGVKISVKSQTTDFLQRLEEVAQSVGCKSSDLYRVMYAESKLDPLATNYQGQGEDRHIVAVGLLQFTKVSFSKIKVSSFNEIIARDAVQQLDLVERYLSGGGPYRSVYDLYAQVFYPSVRKYLNNDSYVFIEAGTKAALQNPLKGKGTAGQALTVLDFKNYINRSTNIKIPNNLV